MDETGNVTGEYIRVSQMILGDDGRRIEKVASKKSNLEWLRITKTDREDFSGAQMALIGDPTLYRLVEQGQDILAVPDLQRAQGVRASGCSVVHSNSTRRAVSPKCGASPYRRATNASRALSRAAPQSLDTSSPLKL